MVLFAVAACAPARSDTPSTPAPLSAVAGTTPAPLIASAPPTLAPPAVTLAPLPSVAVPTLALPSLPPLATTLPLPTGPLPTTNIVKPSPSFPALSTARLTFPVNPVPRGGLVTAIAASEVGAMCSITAPWATLVSGQSLDARRIDITGQASWIWTVGLTVTPGQQAVDLSCVTSGGNAGGRFFVSVN